MEYDVRSLSRRFIAASSASDGAYYRWAKRSNVTLNTLDLLYALDDGLPHSQKQICEEWLIPKTTINTAVKSCRDAGYITLEPMPGHPKQRQLCLTEAGRAYARDALADLHAAEDRAMAETVARFGPEFVDAVELFCAIFRALLNSTSPQKEENNPV